MKSPASPNLPLLCALLHSAAVGGTLNLAGEWRLRLDPEDEGVRAGWPAAPLTGAGRITLPNTTDRAGFGFALDTNTMLHAAPFPVTTRFPGVKEPQRADEHGYLVRRHLFVGPAWYERDLVIPAAWAGRVVTLRLERAMWQTEVWVDGRKAGHCDSLVAEHRHELGILTAAASGGSPGQPATGGAEASAGGGVRAPLAPGRHRLTLRVDNRMIHNLSTVTHAYGPETQSRWNGLVGALMLEAAPPLSIRAVEVFPAPDRRAARVTLQLANATGQARSAPVRVRLFAESGGRVLAETAIQIETLPGLSEHEVTLRLAQPARAWDEFQPVRYRVRATLGGEPAARSEATATFGFRHLERVDRELRLNGRPLFLRGTLDCAVYPRTGHPPMTVPEWERVLGVIKEHGFNHVRFHTWCPPDAAFEAADRLGLYLQPETPAWVDDWGLGTVTKPAGIGRDPGVTEFLRAELRRMSAAYGNHPSFLLCVVGNEFGTQSADWPLVNALVAEAKARDPRRLFAASTARRLVAADDFWVTHNSGAPARGVGPAHTDWDFAKAVETAPVPVISHETGQRPVFPDYATLLPKFTGPLLPLNLERHRRALLANGLGDQVQAFTRASARFQLTQYKAEHEALLRTRGLGGYQLLMLNDFTGQSEALVGVLDPFWESKGVVRPADVRAWNAPVAVLARFPKFVWTGGETFTARIEVASFGPRDLPAGPAEWTLRNPSGGMVARGRLDAPMAPAGRVAELGAISVSLTPARAPAALTLTARFAGVANHWNLWVYPPEAPAPAPSGVWVTTALDDAARQRLRAGGKVLLLAQGVKNSRAARTGFESVYWSAGWWGNQFSSLGVLCDPRHPALRDFPNDGHSDWQWRDLCGGATTFDLTGAPAGFRPIVQPVPDFHYNTLLGHVFEARVEGGALLVCGYDLTSSLGDRPAARQFRRSLYRYAASADFRPRTEVSWTWLEERLTTAGLRRLGAAIVRVSSEDRAHGNVAANVLDGDPATFWHTRWQPENDPLPHDLVVDLGRERVLRGLTLLPRQDQSNGRFARVEIFASRAAEEWTAPLAEVQGRNSGDLQTVRFAAPVTARFLRLRVTAEVSGQPFASLAELEVLLEADANR